MFVAEYLRGIVVRHGNICRKKSPLPSFPSWANGLLAMTEGRKTVSSLPPSKIFFYHGRRKTREMDNLFSKISCGNTVCFKAFLREIVCSKYSVKLISRIYISFFGRSNVALLYVGLAGWLTDVSRGGFCYHRRSGKWELLGCGERNGLHCSSRSIQTRQIHIRSPINYFAETRSCRKLGGSRALYEHSELMEGTHSTCFLLLETWVI